MMKHFAIPKISLDIISNENKQWLIDTGNNFQAPRHWKYWDIAPRLITQRDEHRIQPILDVLPVKPAYNALIIVKPNIISENHIDEIGERVSAVNIPIQVADNSLFRYTTNLEDSSPLEEIALPYAHCFNVKIPHCVDNRFSDQRRIILSFSFTQTVEQLHAAFAAADLL
jgi:hypothetical protein